MAIYYIGVPLLTVVAILDATFMKALQVWGGAPNLMLMVIVTWALINPLEEVLPWAVMGGILRDLLSVAPTGSSALVFILIAVAIDTFLPKINWRNVVIPSLVVGASTFVYDILMVGLLALAGYSRPLLFGLTYVSIPGAIANAILIVIVFRTIGSINAFFRPQRTSLLE